MPIAVARLRCWLRSVWQATMIPVGTWVMRMARLGLVDVLAAGARGAEGVDLEVGIGLISISMRVVDDGDRRRRWRSWSGGGRRNRTG